MDADAGGAAAGFDLLFEGASRSPTLLRIWEEAIGDEYPGEAQPFGFLTRTELERVTRLLRLQPSETVVDLGCGAGGPGLWIALETGAGLVGVDISPVALEQATRRAAALGLADRAHFVLGDLAATGLPDRRFDGAVSFDALVNAVDKPAAVAEAARILRPGARLALTTWDFDADPTISVPEVDAYQVADHRPLLRAAGFEAEVYEVSEGWEERQRAVYTGLRNAGVLLMEEMGEAAALALLEEATKAPHRLPWRRRILGVARRM